MEIINKKKSHVKDTLGTNAEAQELKNSGESKESNKDNSNDNINKSDNKAKSVSSIPLEKKRKRIKDPLNNHLVEEGATFYNDTPYDTLDSAIKKPKLKKKKLQSL